MKLEDILQQARDSAAILVRPTVYATEDRPELTEIPGIVPPLNSFGQDACLFASRCDLATNECRNSRPGDAVFDAQRAACWQAEAI